MFSCNIITGGSYPKLTKPFGLTVPSHFKSSSGYQIRVILTYVKAFFQVDIFISGILFSFYLKGLKILQVVAFYNGPHSSLSSLA